MSKLQFMLVTAFAVVLVAGAAQATTVPTSAAVFLRVFNDCPFSTLVDDNSYPTSIMISDTKASCGAGFANRHCWRFSQDGTTAQEFNNYNGFAFECDITATGTGEGECGIGISPWWSQLVDGTFNLRTTDGEVACFGGRLPFYSFTGSDGVTYTKGTTVHVKIEYMPNGLSEADPATIVYTYDDGTMYTSGPLAFDMGNESEGDVHGLWGILSPATAGGNFQFLLGEGADDANLDVMWENMQFTDLGDAVAAEATTWGSVKSLFQ